MEKGLNFLEEPDALGGPEPDEEPMVSYQPTRRSSHTKKTGLLVFLGAILVVFVFLVISAGRFVNAALAARDSIESMQGHVAALEFDLAQDDVEDLQDALETAQSSLWIAQWAYPIPYVGDQAEALVILVDTGLNLSEVAHEGLVIMQEVSSSLDSVQEALDEVPGFEKEYTFETLPEDVRVEMLQTFSQIGPELAQAKIQLTLAQEKLDDLQGFQLISQMQEAVDQLQTVLPTIQTAVDLLAPFAQSIDELAGVNQDRQWLLLFLNNTEMRPGGGFMGVYGLLQVRDGDIVNITTSDTYAIDQLAESEDYIVEPPFAISEYLGLDTWYFRDANWYADFSESGQTAVQLLRQEYAFAGQPVPEIHGVIGFTPTVVEELLVVFGDITVDGITFTSENFTETLEYEVEYGYKDRGIAWENRKDIINDLVEELLDRLMGISVTQIGDLVGTFQNLFTQKQIGLYSFDAQTQVVFEDAGWAGVIDSSGADDFLAVIDANLGALKTDHAMEKDITYSISATEDGYQAHVTISYAHTGDFDWRTSRYLTYTSILAPLGSELISTTGEDASSTEELGLMRFGSYLSVEPGETKTLEFTYKLPGSVTGAIDSGTYVLDVFKQIGSKQAALTLDLDFDKNLRAAEPAESEDYFGDTSYHGEAILDQDLEFTVQF